MQVKTDFDIVSTSTDIWLALEVGPDFSLPVKASQSVIPERQSSAYLLPSSDIPGAAIRLSLDSGDKKALDNFEELLSDYCAFETDSKGEGTLELLDDRGQLLGTIGGAWQLKEDSGLHKPGHGKHPVLIELPEDGASPNASQQVRVSAAPRDERGQLPAAYQNDWLLRGAHLVSRSMEKGSAWAGSRMLKVADSYVAKTTPPSSRRESMETYHSGAPSQKEVELASGRLSPVESTISSNSAAGSTTTTSGRTAMTFSPQTHTTARTIRGVSGKVCSVSNRTSTAIMTAASNVGDQIGKRTGIQQRIQPDGTAQQPTGFRGALNRSLVAFNVVLDGVTNSAERLLKDGGEASGRMIEHRYGSEAKVISGNVASVGRSAFVVYKDINGVRRKALLKVATGTIKARAPDGGEVVLQQENVVPLEKSGSHGPASPVSRDSEPPPYDPYVRASGVTEKKW